MIAPLHGTPKFLATRKDFGSAIALGLPEAIATVQDQSEVLHSTGTGELDDDIL